MKGMAKIEAVALAFPFLLIASFFGLTRIEDEEEVDEYPYILRMKADEQRRVDTIKDETFTRDGRWIFADPNHDAHYAEQMKALGWQ